MISAKPLAVSFTMRLSIFSRDDIIKKTQRSHAPRNHTVLADTALLYATATMPIDINARIQIPDWELRYTTSRSGGPGGQHVNTTSSRVTLHWSPASSGVFTPEEKERLLTRLARRIGKDGELQIDVEEHRSQLRNREIANERLAQLIQSALHVDKKRKETRPTRGSVERRLREKRATSERKNNRRTDHDD